MAETTITGFLEQLGLTEYEAKTLNSLFKLREAEAPQISRNAQVPKTRVYDVLDRLTKKELIIEVYGRPKKYRVVEPPKVFDKLIKERKEELSRLEEKATSFKKSISFELSNGVTEKVMKVKDKLDFLRILSQEIALTKNSLTAFTDHSKEYSMVSDAIKKLSQKNVKIQIISSLIDSSHDFSKELKNAGIDFKQANHGLEAFILDKKKVILALSDVSQDKPEYHFIIWPENTHMANALQHYFDSIWESTKKI